MIEPGPQFKGRLFHGTASDLRQNTVQPADQLGVTSHWGDTGAQAGQPSHANAFASSDEDQAWYFARHAAARTDGRARVYEVEPHPEMRKGYHEDLKEYVAPWFPAKQRIDIMPGRQGTLPINWKPHQDWENAPFGSHVDPDPNHPLPPPAPHDETHPAVRLGEQDIAHANWKKPHWKAPLQDGLFSPTPYSAAGASDSYAASRVAVQSDRAKHHDLQHLRRQGKIQTAAAPDENDWMP